MTCPAPIRCPHCQWQPSGAIDLYCLYHWAEQRIAGRVCCYAACGAPARWFLGRGDPVCGEHGGVFPVERPGPYERRGAAR